MSSITACYPSSLIVYNGHAGLGANLVDRDGHEIVTDNQDPDAVRAQEARSQCLPEVDDQVLVAFEHGDPRPPYRVGSLYAAASSTNAFVLMADNGGQFALAKAAG